MIKCFKSIEMFDTGFSERTCKDRAVARGEKYVIRPSESLSMQSLVEVSED